MSTQKTPLGGRPISRQEAFKGLGDPKTWKKFSDAVYAEFLAKPKVNRMADSLISTTIEKVKRVFRHGAGQKLAPVYAKAFKAHPIRPKRKPSKMRSRRSKPRKKKSVKKRL